MNSTPNDRSTSTRSIHLPLPLDGLHFGGLRGVPSVYILRELPDDVQPLYVGTSRAVGRRLSAHHQKAWWPLAGTVEVLYGGMDELAAYGLEAHLIRALQPRFNIRGLQ